MAIVLGHFYSDTINHSDGVTDDDDTIFGYGGNDIISGGGGADYIFGGTGFDTSSYTDSGAGVVVSLTTGRGFGGDAEGDFLADIENLKGSAHDDQLSGDGNGNVLMGEDGADTLKGYGGFDRLYGGDDDDKLYGMDFFDELHGENGNDLLDGGAGTDVMIGGIGDDSYYVDSLSDIVTELAGEGQDTVYSTAYNYVLSDAASVEVLSLDTATDTGVYITGNSQHQTIFGNANDNVLNGGGANDILSGLGGNDIFVFQAGQAHGDVVYEFEGNGAGIGDQLQFVGYGAGATFTQVTATEWIIASADNSISEVITFIGGPPIDPTDYVYY